MKPLTIIIWSALGLYGFIFVLYHLWIKPVYHIARTGRILTASQKVAFRMFPFITPATVLVLVTFFGAGFIRLLVIVIKSELMK